VGVAEAVRVDAELLETKICLAYYAAGEAKSLSYGVGAISGD